MRLWIDLLAEDEDAYILTIASPSPDLMARLEPKLSALLDSLERAD